MNEYLRFVLQIAGLVFAVAYLLYVIITITKNNFLEKKVIAVRLFLSLILVLIFVLLGSWLAAIVWMVNVGINTWLIWRENQQEKLFWQ